MTSLEELFDNITREITEKNHKSLLFAELLLKSYTCDDWKVEVDTPDPGTFIKKLLYRDNNIEMFLISWGSKSQSCIHDHPDLGCIVKILMGELEEHVYHKVCKCNILCESIKTCNSKMAFKVEHNQLALDQICYRESNIVLHQILNTSDYMSVSLHIYSKPNYIHSLYDLIN